VAVGRFGSARSRIYSREGMDEVDDRRFLSDLPEPGPGEDSRDTDRPGEWDRVDRVSNEGGERPAGDTERE
jgi:hypothetical protein